jgi:hypothetical protein
MRRAPCAVRRALAVPTLLAGLALAYKSLRHREAVARWRVTVATRVVTLSSSAP